MACRQEEEGYAMATSLFTDPLQFWRDAVTKLEGDINSMATGSLSSQQVVGSLHKLSGMSSALQQIATQAMEEQLRRANLPSRKQVDDLAEALRRVEDKLDQLLPAPAEAVRPARTRRPAAVAAAAAETKAVAAPAVKTKAVTAPPAAKRRRTRTARS